MRAISHSRPALAGVEHQHSSLTAASREEGEQDQPGDHQSPGRARTGDTTQSPATGRLSTVLISVGAWQHWRLVGPSLGRTDTSCAASPDLNKHTRHHLSQYLHQKLIDKRKEKIRNEPRYTNTVNIREGRLQDSL